MSETTTKVRRVKWSDLKNLDAGKNGYGKGYAVVPCENNQCFTKTLNVTDSHFLRIYVSNSNRSRGLRSVLPSGNSIRMEIQQRNYNYDNCEKLEIIVDKPIDIQPFYGVEPQNNRFHYRRNYKQKYFVIENTYYLQVPYFYGNTASGKLVKTNGLYGIDIFGITFPIRYWENTENKIDSLMQAYEDIGSFPIKWKDRDEMAEYFNDRASRLTSATKSDNDRRAALTSYKGDGIKKTLARLEPLFEQVIDEDIFASFAFYMFADHTKKTIQSIKMSTIFNKVFAEVNTKEEFRKKIKELSEVLVSTKKNYRRGYNEYLTKIMDSLDDARELKKAAIRRKSTGAFNKIMDDLDFVAINKETHPLTHEAIYNGDIPKGCMFRSSGTSYFMYNDNWDLWEAMLKDHKEIALQLAAQASKRTTYEKDLMSYFYFTLYALPEYLERHTGKKWTGIPKLITSTKELEPPKQSGGKAKSRSALTPIVDNENNTVTVPYASLRVPGYSTTYTYGLTFNVLHRGMMWEGNAVNRDVETKLNGRDDYGLMFYTFTGSAQGRGYPTFLIIFERLEGDTTRVHFHRTHPMRSKNRESNPIHHWTKGCYKWMVGNVNFDKIKAQQGDLAFVEIDELDMTGSTLVDQYDSHHFEQNVPYLPYTKKKKENILGYVHLEKDTVLSHDEHLDRVIPKGYYEIRQCRSWEANPKGVWTLRID